MNNSEEVVLSPLSGNRPISRNSARLFRSPPQPHMCVQDTLKGSQLTCFINVMSWCKIGIPPTPNAPIPLYGGVKVPLSDRCNISYKHFKPHSSQEKPLVFAVMVNPSILQKNGKLADNPQERDNLVDLILDFIEAMNEDVRFSRSFKVLSDRDLTGELKDIWAVIQAKRDASKSSLSTRGDENCSPPSTSPPTTAKHKKTGDKEETSNMCQEEAAAITMGDS
nr:olfactory receptor 11 [Matsumurasca onukii]